MFDYGEEMMWKLHQIYLKQRPRWRRRGRRTWRLGCFEIRYSHHLCRCRRRCCTLPRRSCSSPSHYLDCPCILRGLLPFGIFVEERITTLGVIIGGTLMALQAITCGNQSCQGDKYCQSQRRFEIHNFWGKFHDSVMAPAASRRAQERSPM